MIIIMMIDQGQKRRVSMFALVFVSISSNCSLFSIPFHCANIITRIPCVFEVAEKGGRREVKQTGGGSDYSTHLCLKIFYLLYQFEVLWFYSNGKRVGDFLF